MPGGKDKPISIIPSRVPRVIPHMACPQSICHYCCSHGQAWVTRIRFLNGIYGEESDGIGTLLYKFDGSHKILLKVTPYLIASTLREMSGT
jgi:hypothetical protein